MGKFPQVRKKNHTYFAISLDTTTTITGLEYLIKENKFLISFQNADWSSKMVAQVVKNPPANTGDTGSVPGLRRSPGEENGNPLQYSCLGNPMDRGDWRL